MANYRDRRVAQEILVDFSENFVLLRKFSEKSTTSYVNASGIPGYKT